MFDDSLLENFSAGTLRFLGMAIMLCACWRQRSPVGSPSTERSGRQVLEVWAAGPEGSSLGSALSVAGDLDGDGQPDLLVGARDAGQAWVFSPEHVATLIGPGAGDSVAGLGDVDGDGYGDVLVGGSGTAWRAYGPLSGTLTLLDGWEAEPGDTDRVRVAAPGDLSGDGRPDILLGTPRADLGGRDAGVVRLLPGEAEPGSIAEAATATLYGSRQVGMAGYTIAGPGDLDGDGLADLLVGAWGDTGFQGRVYCVRGPIAGSLALEDSSQWHGEAAWDVSGWAVTGMGDLDGDGHSDFAVGAYGVDRADLSVGAAYIVSGMPPQERSLHQARARIYGAVPGGQLGWALSPAGDVDGDGIADLLVGAPGEGGGRIVYGPFRGIVDAERGTRLQPPTAAQRNAGKSVLGGAGLILVGAPETSVIYRLP